MQRRTALLLSSVVALSCPAINLAGTAPGGSLRGGPIKHPRISMTSLSSMRINVDTVDTEPINGFIPQVVMGLTNEQDSDSAGGGVEGFGIQSSTPGGSALPTTGTSAFYAIATLDSGSTSNILSYDATQSFDLAGSGILDGGNQTITAAGASGTEDFTVTNAMGFYLTDFSHASVNSGAISVQTSALQGQYNVPALAGNQGDGIPNIAGSPILAQYRVTIQNSQPQHLTVGGVVSQTPKVTLGAFSSTFPAGYSKLSLTPIDGLLGGTESENTPYYLNLNSLGSGGTGGPNDPDTPGTWASLLTSVNGAVGLTRGSTVVSASSFLLDTGAQVSIISNDTASQVGIFNASPATADFTEQVQGVGGITDVPGYYLDKLTLLTQGGVLSWTHVPVLILDVTNPADQTQTLPGILGTSLFSDRDLILNTNVSVAGQTYVAIGPVMQWNHSTGGNWSVPTNWAVVLPNGQDMQANFYSAITAAATINVDSTFTVGRITFDNTNRYTLSGAGPIILNDSTDASQINVRSGNHTIATPITLASDTTVTVIPTTSTLTISSVIKSSGSFGLIQSGFGTVLLSASNTYTGATHVTSGTLSITGSINSSTNVLTSIGAILNAQGAINAGLNKSTVVNSAGTINIGPNPGTSGPVAVTLASIEIGSDPTSNLTVLSSPLHANRTVLVTSGVSFDDTSSGGQIDLKDNDMIIHGSTMAAVQPLLQSGYNAANVNGDANGGYWNGSGIVSSTAANNAGYLTTLGMIANSNGSGSVFSTFDGQAVTASDILIKYTYYGDANLDGKVDGTDYSRLDNGFLNHHLSGWYNGDFNYDGVVDGSDYTLIDNSYNRQGAHLTDEFASIASQIGSSAVPEPTTSGLLACVSLAMLGRRTRARTQRHVA